MTQNKHQNMFDEPTPSKRIGSNHTHLVCDDDAKELILADPIGGRPTWTYNLVYFAQIWEVGIEKVKR